MDKANKAVFDVNAQCSDIMNFLINKETLEELKINISPMQMGGAQVIIPIPQGYEFAGVDDDNQQVVFEKIKPKYPKDFDECCYILETSVDAYFDYDDNNHYPNDYEYGLEKKLLCLRKLLICRDAYWKLIGENMGLDKPWEPDWNGFGNPSYPTIVRCNNRIIKTSLYTNDCILVFPTEEIRDIFYENFKDLIEQCKEILLFV